MKKLIILLVLVLTVVLVFWLGQRSGARIVNDKTLANSLIVRQIAELASLEIQGTATIKRSNLANDGSWTDNMRKMFAESTIWVTVPYTAKFGVNVDEKNFTVAVDDKEVLVSLPATQLLSYELRLDQMETANKKGWFMFSDDETYTDVQKSCTLLRARRLNRTALIVSKAKKRSVRSLGNITLPLTGL